MRPFALLPALVLACANAPAAAPESTEQPVTGRLFVTQPWCAGTPPPQVRPQNAPTPSDVELRVLRGTSNREGAADWEVKPGQDGRFELALPPGEYCIVEAERHAKTPPRVRPPAVVDAACWEDQWAACLVRVTVADEPVALGDVTIQRQCEWRNPCITGAPKLPSMQRPVPPEPKPLPSPVPPPLPDPPPPVRGR